MREPTTAPPPPDPGSRSYEVDRDAHRRSVTVHGDRASTGDASVRLVYDDGIELTFETPHGLVRGFVEPGPSPRDVRLVVAGGVVTGRVSTRRERLAERTTGERSKSGSQEVHSPIPGVVRHVERGPGDAVEQGDLLLSIEAMKMENAIDAPRPGIVERVCVTPGQTVAAGELVAVIEAGDSRRDPSSR